jgi:hypothetical protein
VTTNQSDFKELVPEFYQSGDFLTNSLGIDFGKRQAGSQVAKVVFRIRIHRIRMSLDLPNPDQLVRGMDSDPLSSFYHQAKILRKTLIPTLLWLLLDFLSLKNDVNAVIVPTKSNK